MYKEGVIQSITRELQKLLESFSPEDNFLINNQSIPLNKEIFQPLSPQSGKTIAFIDGGQADILSAANFHLSFIRVCAVLFRDTKKFFLHTKEYYLLTTVQYENNNYYYHSKVFSGDTPLIPHLRVRATDPAISTGHRRAPLSVMSSMARRFSELALAAQVKADVIVLDGTLEATYPKEEEYLVRLGTNIIALAKTSDLVTVKGNNPTVFLHQQFPGCWWYPVTEKNGITTSFVKLHPKSEHVFRCETNNLPEILSSLLPYCTDPIFIGYPYGLIVADQHARVSREEQRSLGLQFLTKNPELKKYLHSKDAHRLLDGDHSSF